MQENTTLNALVMRRARDLLAEYGWPEKTDIDQRDAINRPGWISLYVRLDADEIVRFLRVQRTGEMPEPLQSAIRKLAGTRAEINVSGSRHSDFPQMPGDDTQIAFPWAGEWLADDEIRAVMACLSCAVEGICQQVLTDSRRIKAALSTQGKTLFSRQTRNFRLVVKESDMPCWLDEDDETLPTVLDAIMNKEARYSAVEVFVVSEKVEQILASGLVSDVLRRPGEHPRKWIALKAVHEVIAEARAEIRTIRNTLETIKP